ncbi:MAG: chorismate mutase [Actinobacteria bacterium]|nr:chorismate mutase [Actinomycetota bacterium]
MSVRAIRGAIQVDSNTVRSIHEGVKELLDAVMLANGLTPEEVISVLLTATPDLTADFPAAAAREVGFGAVPLLCASEIDVPGALSRVIRVLLHCETERAREDILHIYLKGAVALRRDLAQ